MRTHIFICVSYKRDSAGTACNKSHLVRVELSTLAGKFVLVTVVSESMCVEEKVGHHFEIQKLTKNFM